MWPAQRPVVGVEAGRRPVGRPAIAQPAGPPVLFRRQFGTCSLGATGRASAPRGLRQGKANVRKDTERSVAAERSRHSRRSLPTLLHCRRCGHRSQTSASGVKQARGGAAADDSFHRPAVAELASAMATIQVIAEDRPQVLPCGTAAPARSPAPSLRLRRCRRCWPVNSSSIRSSVPRRSPAPRPPRAAGDSARPAA